jgi:hypothetical protein
MLVQIFRGVALFFTLVVAVITQPAVLPELVAAIALKYRRTATTARFRVNPETDRVEILCPVTNVTRSTIGAGLLVGAIGWATAVPGSSGNYHPDYVSSKTDGRIAPNSDGELVAAMSGSAANLRGLHLRIFLDLGPANFPFQEFRDDLFLDF